MVENYILRKNARAQLGGGIFKNGWLYMLLACFIVGAVEAAVGTIIPGIGALLIVGPLSYGLARVTTSVVNGKPKADLNDLMKGFTEDVSASILLGLLQTIFTVLWTLLFIIPGIVKSYAYSMAFYIQQDEQNKDWKYCLDKSQAMMKGYKGKLFCLDLSFIGWYILGALCLGVGVLFVMPYHETAKANFYEALKASLSVETTSGNTEQQLSVFDEE